MKQQTFYHFVYSVIIVLFIVARSQFFIKMNLIALQIVLQKITYQIPTTSCLFKVSFAKYQLKIAQRSLPL